MVAIKTLFDISTIHNERFVEIKKIQRISTRWDEQIPSYVISLYCTNRCQIVL